MAVPYLTFINDKDKVSSHQHITVTFYSNVPYTQFEARATKVGEEYGVGKGALIASFSNTPADVSRTFEVYDSYLVKGDGEYRLSLFACGEEGKWNDDVGILTRDLEPVITVDGKRLRAQKEVI